MLTFYSLAGMNDITGVEEEEIRKEIDYNRVLSECIIVINASIVVSLIVRFFPAMYGNHLHFI